MLFYVYYGLGGSNRSFLGEAAFWVFLAVVIAVVLVRIYIDDLRRAAKKMKKK